VDTSPILVVEDDDLVRNFLCRALAGLGCEVDSCGNGSDAMEAVSRRRYGVVLLDGLLPDIHGVDLGRKLIGHVNGSGAGICFVSGTLRRPTPMNCGVSALPKPLRIADLTAAVSALLDWHNGQGGDSPAGRLAMLDRLGAELLVG
jgi:DNA-binding response OmpR family regulator